MPLSWPAKDPNDILDYAVDWSRRLDPGDAIAAASFALPVDAGLTIASQSFTDTTATVWLTNGNAGETASVRCRITTAGGRTMDQSVALPIADR